MKNNPHAIKYLNDHTITFIVYLYRFSYKYYKKNETKKSQNEKVIVIHKVQTANHHSTVLQYE